MYTSIKKGLHPFSPDAPVTFFAQRCTFRLFIAISHAFATGFGFLSRKSDAKQEFRKTFFSTRTLVYFYKLSVFPFHDRLHPSGQFTQNPTAERKHTMLARLTVLGRPLDQLHTFTGNHEDEFHSGFSRPAIKG